MMNPLSFLFRRSLSCEDANSFFASYLDGALREGVRRRFEEHVRRCPLCKTYLDQYWQTIELVREAREGTAEVPKEIVAHTFRRLDREEGAGGPAAAGRTR